MNDPRASATIELDPNLVRVATTFLPGADQFELVAGRPYLIRVHHDGAWWKVRRWPEATPQSRVEFVHRVLELAGAPPPVAPRVLAAPNGATTIVEQGAVYDCQSWLAGVAVAGGPEVEARDGRWAPLPAVVPDDTLIAVLRAVATVHARTADLAEGQQLAAPPLSQLVAAVTQAWKDQRGVLRPLAGTTPAVRRWLAIGERALPAAEAAFAAAGDGVDSRAICHFGLWPAHVIVPDATELEAGPGLIGWEHCNAGSPLVDLAQVICRFRGWSAAGAELAIAAYSEIRPLSPEDRRLLPAVAALDLIATTGQMLIFAYGERPGGARPPSVLREPARTLLDSLDVASNALNAQDRSKRSSATRGRRPGRDRSTQPRRRKPGPQKKR